VAPAQVRQRSVRTEAGRAALLHALAHIEFNAINLALDAIWRFPGLPDRFYLDWLKVAREEAHHFDLLNRHLGRLGYGYGDFPAHNGLWEMAEKTRDDLLARLALVPRTLEARGLDASPLIRDKLAQAADPEGAAILDIILRDEIGHVAIGNHWYRHFCALQGRNPLTAYAELARRHGAPRLRGPFNLEARRAAGFDEAELEALQQLFSARTSPMASRTPRARKSSPRRARPMPMSSSCACRTATTRWSASVGRPCPAASASASRSPARC
jgi:uncharacterized ferritin-like protein (DUF455 family)